MLSAKSINIIQNSAIIVTSNANEITKSLYKIIFTKYPDLSLLFEKVPENQKYFLADAISAFAINIDNLHILKPALNVIAQKHVKKNIKPIHYVMIGLAFVEALELTLKESASLEFIDAWREAFIYLSNTLVSIEKKLYNIEMI